MQGVWLLRWFARVSSLASIGLMVALAAGSHGTSAAPGTTEAVALLFFPLGVVAGFVIAWLHEGVGGAITLGSLVVFYGWLVLLDGRWPHGPYFCLMAAPGLVFLVTWLLDRVQRQQRLRQETAPGTAH